MDYESPEYHLRRHPDLIENYELSVAWSAFAADAYFNHVNTGDNVLEFGAGVANNLLTVKNLVASVTAVEPSILGREIAEKYGIPAFDNIGGVDGRCFDTILCRHVLEHVESPKEVLESLGDHLADDGVLVLVLPIDPIGQGPKQDDLNQHLFCWNPRTINNLALRCGLTLTGHHTEAFGAKRKLLFIYRVFGARAYVRLVRLTGQLLGFKEQVFVFRKADQRT